MQRNTIVIKYLIGLISSIVHQVTVVQPDNLVSI